MKLSLTITILLLALHTYAQDNIVLRNGNEIPAKVLEVNQFDIKFKKTVNPDGPIYTSPLRDVLLIKYANGTKDVFSTAPASVVPTVSNVPHRSDASGGLAATQAAQPTLSGLQYRSHWLGCGQFVGADGQRLAKDRVRSLMATQPDALNRYKQGRSQRTWSVVTGVSALALIGTGAALAIDGRRGNIRDRNGRSPGNDLDDFGRNDRGDRREHRYVGVALAGGGVLLGITSLWLNHRATVQLRRAANHYNNRPSATLRIVPGYQGVGAVFAF